jgi:hypothetical protein
VIDAGIVPPPFKSPHDAIEPSAERDGASVPSDSGYIKIYSTRNAFAALKADGSITAWGSSLGGAGSPPDSGYTKIYSNEYVFAALKADGSITMWGILRIRE